MYTYMYIHICIYIYIYISIYIYIESIVYISSNSVRSKPFLSGHFLGDQARSTARFQDPLMDLAEVAPAAPEARSVSGFHGNMWEFPINGGKNMGISSEIHGLLGEYMVYI